MRPKVHQTYHSFPADKKGRKLDALGQKLYCAATLGFKTANYETVMAGYPLFLQARILLFMQFQLEDNCPLAKVLHMKKIKLSKQQINEGGHSVDLTAGAVAGSIVLKCHAW